VLLNLGHTVGHALEAESLASPAPLRHGEAVGLGLVAAARVGAALFEDLAVPALEAEIAALLARLGLPADLDAALARHPASLARLGADKKRAAGAIRYVALPAPGAPRVTPLEPARLAAVLHCNNPGPPGPPGAGNHNPEALP
jgi:3-dehydroquinate synthase